MNKVSKVAGALVGLSFATGPLADNTSKEKPPGKIVLSCVTDPYDSAHYNWTAGAGSHQEISVDPTLSGVPQKSGNSIVVVTLTESMIYIEQHGNDENQMTIKMQISRVDGHFIADGTYEAHYKDGTTRPTQMRMHDTGQCTKVDPNTKAF